MLDQVQAIRLQDDRIQEGIGQHMTQMQEQLQLVQDRLASTQQPTTVTSTRLTYRDFLYISMLFFGAQFIFSMFRH